MYARSVAAQFQPGKIDEAISLFQESVIPAAQKEPGFVSIMLLTDRTTNSGLVIAVWESEAALLANEDSGYFQEQLAKFGGVLAAPPVRVIYEVGAHS